jgi:hypothetical protein
MKTTSLDLSKRLHEKGFKAEHEYVWIEHYEGGKTIWSVFMTDPLDIVNKSIPAFQFHELFEVVPEDIEHEDGRWSGLNMGKSMTGNFVATYLHPSTFVKNQAYGKASPVEALGLLVEWLIDNGHLEVNGG